MQFSPPINIPFISNEQRFNILPANNTAQLDKLLNAACSPPKIPAKLMEQKQRDETAS
jgi:hypothetical protein